ncbi:fibrinogen C domain-containing protein 1-like [Polymixia lowei]
MNDRWTIMNNSASELDTKPHKHKRCCRVVLWSIFALVAITAVVTGTVIILYLNHSPLPFISRGGVTTSGPPPIISTNQKENGALVTVSRSNSEPINIFLDPNCPDYSDNFLRWEKVQTSLLRVLTNIDTDDWGERGLVQKLGEELKLLSGHAHSVRLEADSLKRGQGILGQRLDLLQNEQTRIIQAVIAGVLLDRAGGWVDPGQVGLIAGVLPDRAGGWVDPGQVGLIAGVLPDRAGGWVDPGQVGLIGGVLPDRAGGWVDPGRVGLIAGVLPDRAGGWVDPGQVGLIAGVLPDRAGGWVDPGQVGLIAGVLPDRAGGWVDPGRVGLIAGVLPDRAGGWVDPGRVGLIAGVLPDRAGGWVDPGRVGLIAGALPDRAGGWVDPGRVGLIAGVLPDRAGGWVDPGRVGLIAGVLPDRAGGWVDPGRVGLIAGVLPDRAGGWRETESLRKLKIDVHKPTWQARGFRPRDCSELLAAGGIEDGVYSVFPTHDPDGFMVYCDMSTEGGGWTVIQRREDGSVNFYRDWASYRDGFGKTTGEHWLGLQRLYALTGFGGFELRIDMADFENGTVFAHYGHFAVGLDSVNPEEDGYPLTVEEYSGTAGDSLLKHSGMRFTTKDRDQDQSENNCAAYYQGAWWYRNCHTSNLNGQYLHGGHASYADGVEWSSWTGWQYSLKFTEMKIRPATNPKPNPSNPDLN